MSTDEAIAAISPDQQNPPLVGYISSWSSDENGQLGVTAYLSVDEYGMPVEFLRTDAVNPSEFTRILYGRTLGQYAHEKAAGALLKEIKQQPKCVVVDQSDLLRPNPPGMIDFILLQDAASPNTPPRLQGQEVEVAGRRCHMAASDAEVAERAKQLLEGLTWDPLEPFERLQKAQQALESRAHQQ
jgi:hypothetical protein